MKTLFNQAADFQQERDFGQKISATFSFLGVHWRPLLKCVLYFVVPGALLAGIGLGLMMNPIFNQAAQVARGGTSVRASNEFLGASYFSGFGLLMLGALLALGLLLATVYAYTSLLCTEEATPPPTPAQVWQRMRQGLGRMFLSFIVLGVFYVALFMLMGLLVALAKAVGLVLMMLLVLPALLYVVVPLSLFFPIMWHENLGVMAALRRSFELVAGHWWATLGLLLVVSMVQSMLSVMFVIPFYASLFGKMLHIRFLESDIFGLLGQCLYTTGSFALYAIPLLASLFQYFHLVERKEGHGLYQLVARLGQQPAPVAANASFSPTDDGEY